MAIMLTEVTINSVDVTSKLLKWKAPETKGDEIHKCEIEVTKNIDGLGLTLEVDQTVTVKRGTTTATDYYVFKGEVIEFEETGYSYKIICYDELFNAIRRQVHYTFDKNVDVEAGQISEIFQTLINDYTDLTADGTTVQTTPSNTDLDQFVCRHQDVYDKLKELAIYTGYQFYYKASTDKVYFEPVGYTSYATALEVGSNVTNTPKWKTDAKDMCNKAIISGAVNQVFEKLSVQLDVTSGWTSGDGGGGTLSYKPTSVEIYADVANPPTTIRVGGKVGSTASYDYSVDFENKKLTWETSGGYNWTANHFVDIYYSYNILTPVTKRNESSIASYGLWERTFNPNQIMTVEDAKVYTKELTQVYGSPFRSTMLHVVGLYDLEVGQTVNVIDTNNSIDSTYVINKIVRSYPHHYDQVYVGDRELKTSDFEAEVARKLYEHDQLLAGDETYFINLVDLTHPIEYDRKSFTQKSRTIGTAFIIGHFDNGVLGTSTLGAGTLSGWSTDYTVSY